MMPGCLHRAGALLCLTLIPIGVRAQLPTGAIAGVVTDTSGAVIAAAHVTVSDPTRGITQQMSTGGTGTYSAWSLLPGRYEVRVEAAGFRIFVAQVTVEVGRTAALNVPLQIGARADTLQVTANAVQVNPTQTSLEGVVTPTAIRALPLNGRNFLDLGQLEPGVQVVPDDSISRGGFTRLSVANQTGLTTRVTVDGLEINDEHAGSVAMNLAPDAIEEFQISRANFDISTGLTGSGAVNIVTKSGSNDLHGGAFLFWRDATFAARIGPQPMPFDREQAGFSLGGPFLRNRLFWFVNYERNRQDAAAVTNIPQFPQLSGTWPSPFDERMATGRLDGNVMRHVRAFFRFTHNWNDGISGRSLGGLKLAPMEVGNNANQSALGLEVTAGRFTHSLRVGYLNDHIFADTALDMIPAMLRTLDPGGRLITLQQGGGGGGALGGSVITLGAHPNSPIRRLQHNHEARYDGGFSFGRHALRWGTTVDFIRVNWFETLNGRAPQINFRLNAATITACGSDILCYPVANVLIGNGLGYFTEVPTLGQPHGGAKNNRFHWYVGDSWRAHPRLTVNLGLRWVYEPGPGNSDLQRPAILDQFMPGLATRDRNDRDNFAPQIGLAWAPSAKWVVRAATSVFYDVNRLQNVMYAERSSLIPAGITGEFQGQVVRDPNSDRVIFDVLGRQWDPPALVTPRENWVGLPIRTPGFLDAVFAAQDAFRAAYQLAYANFPAGPSNCELRRVCTVVAPGYQTPYAMHLSVGVQRELRPGLVLSADYVRNRSLHFMMRHDANRTGAADTLDVKRAKEAMNAVQEGLGCDPDAAGVDCAIAAKATLANYVNAGLGSSATASISRPSNSAFPGIDPNFNAVTLLTMSGFSNYNALQVNLRGRLPNVGAVVRDASVVVSYALSRLEGTAEDQAVVNSAERVDNDNPAGFRGPTSLDRTHMLSVAGRFTVPGGVQLNSLWKAFSPLAQTLFAPQIAGAGDEIFYTDFNGDGRGQDVLPGTNRGSYGRVMGCGGGAVNRAIDQYNFRQAGNLTPAGQALVNAGLFTRAQLVRLGAVSPKLERANTGQVCLDSFLTTDLRIARPFKLKGDRITIEPALEWFNLFNVANFDLPDNKLNGALTGAVGSLNGTTAANRPNRAGGTGSFVLGAPRSWQLALRVSF